jgi:phage gpG-like protein
MARWNPKYELDLVEIFDRAYRGEDEELSNRLRYILSFGEFKTIYGQRLVDQIVDRTQDSLDKNGKPLGTYKASYKDTVIFKLYKGNKQTVDLTLTGDMLSSLRARPKGNYIIINLEGEENRSKAQGHISGIYGKKGRTAPRDFLGLPKDVEEKIMKQTIKEFRQEKAFLEAEAEFSNG